MFSLFTKSFRISLKQGLVKAGLLGLFTLGALRRICFLAWRFGFCIIPEEYPSVDLKGAEVLLSFFRLFWPGIVCLASMR